MPVFSNALAGAAGSGGAADFKIERSLRFNSSDSSSLIREVTTKGSTKKFTWSGWIKRGKLSSGAQNIFSGSTGTDTGAYFCFPDNASNALGTADALCFKSDPGAGGGSVETDAVFRDPSAWYHVVLAVDTTQATASNRVKIWVNGVSQSLSISSSPGYPNQNAELSINDVGYAAIGAEANGSTSVSSSRFFGDFYLADVHFLDGIVVSNPDGVFGEFDADTGVWNPKKYSGSYGTNGFRLNFSDNSSNAALGTDSSGNSNTWTVNNISVLQGTGHYLPSVTISTGGYTRPLLNGFDGDTSTATEGDTTGSVVTVPISTTISAGGVRVYAAVTSTNPLVVNIKNGGTTVETFTGNQSGGQWYASSSYSGTITALEISRTNRAAEFNAIEVNGTVLVDYRAESANDSLLDSPTNYEADSGNNGGNYATLNPLNYRTSTTLSNGNLQLASSANYRNGLSTISLDGGKYYIEAQIVTNADNGYSMIGVSTLPDFQSYPGADGSDAGFGWLSSNGTIYHSDATQATYSSWTVGDVVSVAYDSATRKSWIAKNGVWQNSGDPAAGTGSVRTSPGTDKVFFSLATGTNGVVAANFGARSFAYTPPTGFKSLCTQNFDDPPIADPSTAFDIDLYTGTGATHERSELSFNPDLVWIKQRDITRNNLLFDTLRGANKFAVTNSTGAPGTGSGMVTSFDNDGFTLGNSADVNQSSGTYVSWAWDAGSSTVTNTDGTHSAQVRADPSTGFSISTHSRTTAASISTWGHGLNAAPEFAILKPTNGAYGWFVWHKSLDYNKRIYLNSGGGPTTYGFNVWSSNSTTLGVYGTIIAGGGTALDCLTYAWAPIEGYSAFGSYTGNGSADGPFVYTGFRVRYLLQKRVDSSGSWAIKDGAREPYNVVDTRLYADSSSADMTQSSFHEVDFLSNGFKVKSPGGSEDNANGATYIYAAFAEHPFKTARAR